ncbi:vesicle-trafficking protein SEC22a isoform X2 [Struthio camelus]|uniref:vesicle-trafficking protein SEC22a isoform X2 n=1 Tax=Struthio camelus TaxID=8801 RepID=UPI003603CAF1
MSMILSASVVRVRDGLPLSASTDYDQSTGVQECRKYFKMLSKKLSQLPDRCTLKTGQYNINFISSLGVSYMMLCTENYPSVLAFCFLDELQKEFITTYNMMKTNTAIRPYCFIEFDNFIQRTKQRYNNTRSLSTKMNLADMQTEIKLRPPYQISMSELGSANGFAHLSATDYKGTGKISAERRGRFQLRYCIFSWNSSLFVPVSSLLKKKMSKSNSCLRCTHSAKKCQELNRQLFLSICLKKRKKKRPKTSGISLQHWLEEHVRTQCLGLLTAAVFLLPICALHRLEECQILPDFWVNLPV